MCVDYLYYIRVGFVFSTLIINEIYIILWTLLKKVKKWRLYMGQVKFDYSLTNGIVSEDEIKSMAKIAKDAKDVLVSKSGAGNDFLGWIDLPVDYDKEEFARIQQAAEKISSSRNRYRRFISWSESCNRVFKTWFLQ